MRISEFFIYICEERSSKVLRELPRDIEIAVVHKVVDMVKMKDVLLRSL